MKEDTLHILYVLPKQEYFLEGHRGRVTHAIGVAYGMAKNGVKMHICSGPGMDKYTLEFGSGVTFHEIPMTGKGIRKNYIWKKNLSRYIEILLQTKPDIKIVIIRYAPSSGFTFLPLIRKFPKCTWIFEVNSLFIHQGLRVPSFIHHFVFVFERYVVDSADLVYVVSSGLKKLLTSKKGGINEKKVLVIPNAGKADMVHIRNSLSVSSNDRQGGKKFAYMGIFQSYYEFDIVAEAFRQVQKTWSDTELHLFGYGGIENEVRSIFKTVPKVIFHGRYNLQSLVETGIFSDGWIFLLPYADQHADQSIRSPIKMFEYMALGLPIIASRVGQVLEMLQDEHCVFLYKPGSVKSLVGAMVDACKSTELSAMGYAAQQAFLSKHTWEKRMETFLAEIQGLL